MKLEPIVPGNLDEACRLLQQGFARPPDFWRGVIDRARSVAHTEEWQVGHLFRNGDRAVGVLLAFVSSRRKPDGETQIVVGQSNWYLEPEARARGLIVSAGLLRRKDRACLDLYPHDEMRPVLAGLGFETWSEGFLLLPFPETLLSSAPPYSRVVALADLPAGALDADDRQILTDHERLGYIAAALDTGGGWRPLVFARRSVKRIPCAYLIYGESRAEILDHRRAIGHFLIRRGLPVLAVEGRRADFPGRRMFVGRRPRLFRGEFLRDRVDLAYSELVFLDAKAKGNGIS